MSVLNDVPVANYLASSNGWTSHRHCFANISSSFIPLQPRLGNLPQSVLHSRSLPLWHFLVVKTRRPIINKVQTIMHMCRDEPSNS